MSWLIFNFLVSISYPKFLNQKFLNHGISPCLSVMCFMYQLYDLSCIMPSIMYRWCIKSCHVFHVMLTSCYSLTKYTHVHDTASNQLSKMWTLLCVVWVLQGPIKIFVSPMFLSYTTMISIVYNIIHYQQFILTSPV